MRRLLPPPTLPHPAYRLRVAVPPVGSWGLEFDASSHVRGGGIGYGEWAFVLKSSGATLFTRHGPTISEPYCNLYGEWEGLVAGLDFLAEGRIGGLRSLAITGDERTVIGQLHGTRLTRDDICAGWKALAIDLLALIGKPWSARKVSRTENRTADLIAGGG